MNARWTAIVLMVCVTFLEGCDDDTPADIRSKLVPKIAEELINDHTSRLIKGLTPEIQTALKRYPASEVEYVSNPPDLLGEAGIRFCTRRDHKAFLDLELFLNADMNGYGIQDYSIDGVSRDKSSNP